MQNLNFLDIHRYWWLTLPWGPPTANPICFAGFVFPALFPLVQVCLPPTLLVLESEAPLESEAWDIRYPPQLCTPCRASV